MTLEEQKQLILSGEMYNDLTTELIQTRESTVFLTNEYNNSFGRPQNEREEILKRLLKSIGNGVHFETTLRCEFGFNITIGDNFYANFDCVMLDGGAIDIGNNVLFGPRVGIYTSNHATDSKERVAGGCYAKPVKIGNNVWIGAGVNIIVRSIKIKSPKRLFIKLHFNSNFNYLSTLISLKQATIFPILR